VNIESVRGSIESDSPLPASRRTEIPGIPPAEARRRWLGRGILWGAVAAAFIFIAYVPVVKTPDSESYLAPARSWARGQGLREADGSPLAYRMPAFPLAVGVAFRVFGESDRVVGALNATCLILAGLMVRRGILDATGPFVADIAAAATILYPPMLSSTGLVLQEVFLALLTTALFVAARAALIQHGVRRFFAAGVALGACVLGKTTALACAPFMLLLVCARGPGKLRRGAALTLGVVLVIAPLVARNRLALGRFEFGQGNGGHAFLGGTVSNQIGDWYEFPEYRAAVNDWNAGDRRDWPVLDRYLAYVAIHRVLHDPIHWLVLCGERACRFLLPARTWFVQVGLSEAGTFPPGYVLATALNLSLFGCSAMAAARALRMRDEALAVGPLLVFTQMLVYALTYVSPRYAVTITPVLIATTALQLAPRFSGASNPSTIVRRPHDEKVQDARSD